jgi:DeoR/GlpR family transcriptional regulator of sugar metabolism
MSTFDFLRIYSFSSDGAWPRVASGLSLNPPCRLESAFWCAGQNLAWRDFERAERLDPWNSEMAGKTKLSATKRMSPKAPRRTVTGDAVEPRSALLAEPRRAKILEWLQEEGSARVRDLSTAFGVSEVTVRQDLERLEQDGLITRDHGGAYLNSVRQQVQTLSLQHLAHMDRKRKIGKVAANLVSDHETIILDAGSTTTEVANHLTGRDGLTVITNALNIALTLGAIPSFEVHMPGGHFKAPTLSLSGEKSGQYFENIFASKLFLATAGVSVEAGLTYPSFADLPIKQAMIKAASEVYLVADSTKVNRNSFTRLCGLELIHAFITDDGISDLQAKAIESMGIKIIVAS